MSPVNMGFLGTTVAAAGERPEPMARSALIDCGVAFYQIITPWYPGMSIAPARLPGFLFGIDGFAGMHCGACFRKFVPARRIKWLPAFSILSRQ
jgi:hypothetical protein